MTDLPIAIPRGRDTPVALKWHKLRLNAADAPFRRDRLITGLAVGAMIEVDLQPVGTAEWICLHDDRLEDETTGHGPLAQAEPGKLRDLVLRGSGGEPTLWLDEIVEVLAEAPDRGGQLQLDIKTGAAAVSDAAASTFRRMLRPVAHRLVVSGGNWQLIQRLTADLSAVGRGFDPIDLPEAQAPAGPTAWHDLIAATLTIAADADWIYLDHRLILGARRDGVDLVDPFRAAGARVDAWTVDAGPANDWRATVRTLLECDVDQITTNTPCALAEAFCR